MKPIPPADDDGALEEALRRSRTLVSAPETVVQRAIDLFAARARTAAAPAPGLRQRLLAALSFDSGGAAGLSFGLRSTGTVERQLLYSVGDRDIDLRIAGTRPGRWRIAGQVLGPDRTGTATLAGPGGERVVPWSELAEFSFDDVGEGRWTLSLAGDDWETALPAIDLPPGGPATP